VWKGSCEQKRWRGGTSRGKSVGLRGMSRGRYGEGGGEQGRSVEVVGGNGG